MNKPERRQRERGALNPGEPWQVQFDVYLEDETPRFRVESCLPYKVHDDEKYFIFENHHRPGFRILFQLHDLMAAADPTRTPYTFPRNADEAIWSKRGIDACPDSNWGRNEVFDPQRVVEPERTMLVVDFGNRKTFGPHSDEPVGDFRYTLIVTNGGRPLHLDPGGTGVNGSTRFA